MENKNNAKDIKKLEKYINKIESKYRGDSTNLSDYLFIIKSAFSDLARISEYEHDELSPSHIKFVYKTVKDVEEYVNKILSDPNCKKFVKKNGKFASEVLEGSKNIVEKLSLDKPVEIVIAENYLSKMKKVQQRIKPTYDKIEDFIFACFVEKKNASLVDNYYSLKPYKTEAINLNKLINDLSTTDEGKARLEEIKVESSKLCDAISLSVDEGEKTSDELKTRINAELFPMEKDKDSEIHDEEENFI